MGQIIGYYIGFNAVDSSILIGKTVEEAEQFMIENNVVHVINGKNRYVNNIRVLKRFKTKDYCTTRLNVLIEKDKGEIYSIQDVG